MRLPSLGQMRAKLDSFISSTADFRVLHTVLPARGPVPHPPSRPTSLHVLDSSFNPPTKAHLHLATSALATSRDRGLEPLRLVLLLATQNADKALRPAAFEHRLMMMVELAHECQAQLARRSPDLAVVDIAVTKCPYFHDKAAAISAAFVSSSDDGSKMAGFEQLHLIGFDTLIRILDTKYYPPEHSLARLNPFLSRNRLRVTYRLDSDGASKLEQEAYLQALADGTRQNEGARPEWAQRIELVEAEDADDGAVSSTKARALAAREDHDDLRRLTPDGVAAYVVGNHLYKSGHVPPTADEQAREV